MDVTVREAQEAADLIGSDMVDELTDGLGLSGASMTQLVRVVMFARIVRAGLV